MICDFLFARKDGGEKEAIPSSNRNYEWKVIKVEGGEVHDRKGKLAKKKNPLATYILVIIILTVALVIIAPEQFKQFTDAFYSTFAQLSQVSQVLIVLILIAMVIYLLRRLGKF